MAIARPTPVVVQVAPTETLKDGFVQDTPSVPREIYDYFGLDGTGLSERVQGKLKDIYEWAKDGSKDTGDMYLKMSVMERELGSPRWDEKRYDKLWLWVEMTKKLSSIEKQRASLKT